MSESDNNVLRFPKSNSVADPENMCDAEARMAAVLERARIRKRQQVSVGLAIAMTIFWLTAIVAAYRAGGIITVNSGFLLVAGTICACLIFIRSNSLRLPPD